MKPILIIYCAFCIVNCALLCSCKAQKPVATTHTERIEERVMPIPVGADTIEITEYRLQSTDIPCSLLPTPYSIKSTRGVNISRYKTDTTSMLRITLRPDTVFVPYINHIRSDTIVVPDRICQQKLNRSNMTNLFLILILIIIFIILLKNRMTR